VVLISSKEGSVRKLGISVGLIFLLCSVDVNAQESVKFDAESNELGFTRWLRI